MLFNKDEKCIVELTFQLENDSLKPLFESWDLEYDRECLMRREISPKGKSRAFINDTPVNLQQMKTLGSQLIDVHSQHDSLLLVDQNYQLKMLDTLIDDQSVIEDYKLHYQTYIKLKQEIEKLKSELSSNLAEMDFLRFQLNEIEAANLVANEFEELQQRLLMLDHAEEIKTSLVEINSILQQGEQPIISELTQLKRQLEKLRKYLPQATSLDERLDTVLIELKDISFETDQLEADVQFDPDELEQASARMDLINHLMHKHHLKSFDQLLKLKTELAERLSNIDSSEDILAQKTKLFDTNFLKLKALATTIHKQRLAAAQPFQQSVSGLLKQLGMPFGSFKIDCTPTASITDLGMSRVRFLFSANKGIAEAEIDKVASGGELSRLMLAIKWMIAGAGFVSTVIFDEIDTGVSGEVAARVARLLRQMSGKVQLINITHLPQIASKADAHFFVFKEESKERSFTNMRLLDLDERYEEVAKMISNDAVSEVALQAAKSLFEVN